MMDKRTIPTEYYGDNTRWFVARVIDGSPPPGLEGRVRVRIFGIHSDNTNDIPQADLPWAQVMKPSNSYGVSGFGVMPHIQANALVFGIFLDGSNSQLPLVLGSLPQIEYPTSVQAAGRQDIAVNPFAYDFDQSNSSFQDPIFENTTFGTENVDEITPLDAGRFFLDNGLPPKQAASVAGTLQEISNLNPRNEGGIAGYPKDSPRYARFVAYCSRLKPQKDINSADVQLMYILHELHTTHKTAYGKMLMAKDIRGNLYGENVDGVDKKGNGIVAVLDKYFVHASTSFSKGGAEGKSESIYGSMGAR